MSIIASAATAAAGMTSGVFDGSIFDTIRFPSDELKLRVTTGGVQVLEYVSEDRDGPPAHTHPWHEVEYVIDGSVEFLFDGRWIAAGPGAVQMLPAGTAHSVRVPAGTARLLMVTIGAPYDGFARDLAALYADGPVAPAAVIDVAGRHGVRLAH
ncbi:MAG: cupin domain-containing protein [Acidimicrobiia bacterium]